MYKVAELLGLSSQDAMALLKSETGIDVKSASSSIEEIVARQFVERQARKRQISLPTGPLFADAPAAKKPGSKSAKAPEPPKPAGPVLRPRLVKTLRPTSVEGEHADAVSDAGAHELQPGDEHVAAAAATEAIEEPLMAEAEPDLEVAEAPVEDEAPEVAMPSPAMTQSESEPASVAPAPLS